MSQHEVIGAETDHSDESLRAERSEHVLLTGGAGYIGSVLADKLLQKGYEVTVLDRLYFGNGLQNLQDSYGSKLHVVEGDVRSVDSEILKGKHAVLDLASLSNDPAGDLDPSKTLDINFKGRARMAKEAKAHGVSRYILASSCSVYGFQVGVVDEESTTRPLTTYAESAEFAEMVALALADKDHEFTTTALRQATVYGPSQGTEADHGRMRFDLVINIWARDLVKKGQLALDPPGTQMRPFVHIEDTANAFIHVMEAEREAVNGKVFNVGSTEQNYSMEVLARTVCQAAGIKPSIEWRSTKDARSYAVDFGKIYRELGYETQFTVADAVKSIIERVEKGTIDTSDRSITMGHYRNLLRENAEILDPLPTES